NVMEKLLIDEREAAVMLGVSARTLWSLSAGRQIPVVRIGRRKLYAVESLRAWIRERETAARAQGAALREGPRHYSHGPEKEESPVARSAKSGESQESSAMECMQIENVLSKLAGVRKAGKGWKARCPAHDDQNPSLSVDIGDEGRVLLYCHAGCTLQAVCDEM